MKNGARILVFSAYAADFCSQSGGMITEQVNETKVD